MMAYFQMLLYLHVGRTNSIQSEKRYYDANYEWRSKVLCVDSKSQL